MDSNEGSLNTGKVVEEIPEELYEKAAKDFSEGNPELEQLLLYCFRNGIQTFACCAGHGDEYYPPYIAFRINDKTYKIILRLIKELSNSSDIELAFSNYNIEKRDISFVIYSKGIEAHQFFRQIRQICKSKEEISFEDLSYTDRLIIKTIRNHSIDKEYYKIRKSITKGEPNYLISLPTTYRQYILQKNFFHIIPEISDAFLVETESIDDVNEILEYVSNVQEIIKRVRAFNKAQETWERTITSDDLMQIDSNPQIADKIKVNYINTIRKPLFELMNNSNYSERVLDSIILSLNSDEEKTKLLPSVKSLEYRVKIVASLKSDEEKIKILNSFTDELDRAKIIASLQSDKTKLKELDKIENETYRSIVIAGLKSDRKKLKFLSKTKDQSGREIIIASLDSDKEKIKRLDEFTEEYYKSNLISGLKSDKEKLKLINTIQSEALKIQIIASLNSDEEKLKWINTHPSLEKNVTIISSLKSDSLKIKVLDDDKINTQDRLSVLKSLQSDDEKIRRLDSLDSAQQKIALIASMKSNKQKILYMKLCNLIFDERDQREYHKAKSIIGLGKEEKLQLISEFNCTKIINWILDSTSFNIPDLQDMDICYSVFYPSEQIHARTLLISSIGNPSSEVVPPLDQKREHLLDRVFNLREILGKKVKELAELRGSTKLKPNKNSTEKNIVDD